MILNNKSDFKALKDFFIDIYKKEIPSGFFKNDYFKNYIKNNYEQNFDKFLKLKI